MPVQTRSMTRRAGTPHDLEAFNSYADDSLATDNNVSEVWLMSKDLPKIRKRIKTRRQWTDHVSALCWHLSYADTIESDDLTLAEYQACHAFMHGKSDPAEVRASAEYWNAFK